MALTGPTRPYIATFRNALLRALPLADLALLRPHLELVTLTAPQVLYASGDPIGGIYFIEVGWVSEVLRLEDGDIAEVGLVGSEGMVGLGLVLGANSAFIEAMVQGSGTALRVRTGAFQRLIGQSPPLRSLLLRYAASFQAQLAQTAACNGRHTLSERLARWLLIAHDRADGNRLPLTQDFIAMMLGVRRSGVTVAAGMLQTEGLIQYSRGQITVIDRQGLEGASCECYGSVEREYVRLLPEVSERAGGEDKWRHAPARDRSEDLRR